MEEKGAQNKEIENKYEIKKKINKAKSWFFERTDKIDKPLERLIKKKRQSTNYQYQVFFKGDIMNPFTLTNWKVWVA